MLSCLFIWWPWAIPIAFPGHLSCVAEGTCRRQAERGECAQRSPHSLEPEPRQGLICACRPFSDFYLPVLSLELGPLALGSFPPSCTPLLPAPYARCYSCSMLSGHPGLLRSYSLLVRTWGRWRKCASSLQLQTGSISPKPLLSQQDWILWRPLSHHGGHGDPAGVPQALCAHFIAEQTLVS